MVKEKEILNYRKVYKSETGIVWDTKKYDVHHIDENRRNNNIGNLVLLPKKIHKQYHYFSSLMLARYNFNILSNYFFPNDYECYEIQKYIDLKCSIFKFIQLRNDILYRRIPASRFDYMANIIYQEKSNGCKN